LKYLLSSLVQGKDNSSSPLTAIKKYIPNTPEIKELEKKIRSLKPKLENLTDSKKRITDQSKDLISSEFEILNKKPFTEINKFIENQENGLWLRIVARDGSNNSILKYMKDLSRIQNEEREYKKRKEEIQTNFDLENLLFDEPEIKSSAKELIATNFLSFFDKAWWKARSVFNSLNKISNTNYPAKQKGKLLQELCSYLNNTKQQETSFDKTKSQLDEMKGSIESEDELLENFNEICNEVELKEIERQVNFFFFISVS
jgi:vacuolar-type H+-ATPase subunit I/STV1